MQLQFVSAMSRKSPEAAKTLKDYHAKIWDPNGGLNNAGAAKFANEFPNASRHSTLAMRDPGRVKATDSLKFISRCQSFISREGQVQQTSCCNMVDNPDEKLRTNFKAICHACLVVCDMCSGGREEIGQCCKHCPIALPTVPLSVDVKMWAKQEFS